MRTALFAFLASALAFVACADVYDCDYDVVVVGGTSYGVAAALEAKAAGASVMVVAPRPYLGEDVAGKWRLLREKGDDASDPLYAALYPERTDVRISQRGPFTLKHALDAALETAKIPFRTWTPVYGVAKDAAGNVVGVRTVNRSGRRIIRARLVVDATERAWVSQCAGARFAALTPGEIAFTRYVVSGDEPKADGLSAEPLSPTESFTMNGPFTEKGVKSTEGRLWRCVKSFPVRTGSAFEFAAIEQAMRAATWTRRQLDGAETCLCTTSDRLLEPAHDVLTLGPRTGNAYLQPGKAMVAARQAIRARLAAAKARTLGAVAGSDPWGSLDEIAVADVVVAGVGTGGAPAAIAAGRAGAKVVALEFGSKVGGLTTDGLIGGYWYGNVVGFTKEIDAGTRQTGLVFVQAKEEWFRREIVQAGVTLVLGAFAADVVKDGDRLTGVVAVMPDGSAGVIRCPTAVDATGNADLAAAAGDPTEFIGAGELAVQGAAFTRKNLGRSSMNVDFTFVNDTDADDLWYLSLRGRNCYQSNTWDQAQIVSSRERRRIRGLAYVTPQDVMLGRKWPDTVVITRSNFDTHGQTIGVQFFIDPPPHTAVYVNLPYRALLPERTDGLIVVGLGLSAHRDAMPILRMQPDVQNQGWVAGTACAQAVKTGKTLKTLNVKELQRASVACGNIPEEVLDWQDTFPLSDGTLAAAVESITNDYEGLAAVYAESKRALPLVRDAWRKTTDEAAKLKYAHVLGLAGDATGAESLVRALADCVWDEGWNYRGMGQFGRSVSWIDSYAIALGRTRSAKAFGPLKKLAVVLMPFSEYSHFRAISLAFEALGDVRAKDILADLLNLPGVGGHAMDYTRDGAPRIARYDVYNFSGPNAKKGRKGPSVPDYERTLCLRELCLARALYNLGDKDGLAERTLRAYANDPRRAYAAHAQAVLAEPARPKTVRAEPERPKRSALDCVDPLIGTEGTGSQYGGIMPYTCTPFGSFHLVPMTRLSRVGQLSFNQADDTLLGFILTRQPAIWMGDWGEVRIPIEPAKITAFESTPYRGKIVAGGRTYEYTATAHAAWIRGDIDQIRLMDGYNTNRDDENLGYPLPNFKGWRCVVHRGHDLQVGVSLISLEQARRNLAAEIGGRSFEEVAGGTKAEWERLFSRIEIQAPENVRTIFYTGLFHTLLYPRQIDEQGRYYSAMDDKVHEGTAYTCYSLWDTYRCEHPWLTLIAPERVDGMMQSLVDMYKEGGWLPKWPNPSYTGIMIGAPAEVTLAEAYVKGFRGFDLRAAYAAVKKNATVPQEGDGKCRWQDRGQFGRTPETRGGLKSYMERGYVACDETAESVSRTQDFGLNDLSAAILAEATGHKDDAAYFRARAKNYTNLWNAAAQEFHPRLANGSFKTGLAMPFRDYCEQSPHTGVWAVPFDTEGLARLMGGRDRAIAKLDEFFDTVFWVPERGNLSIHGNEPSHHCAYLYNRWGAPEKTQRRVRDILTRSYSTNRKGFDGNEDCGQMSAWYIFSALGFYPLDPASGEYELGSPLVKSATLRIGAPYPAATLRITAKDYAPDRWRVRRVTLNGHELADWRVRHADLVKGGDLVFEME